MNKYTVEGYFLNFDSYEDLTLYEVGLHHCPPLYSFGPIIRRNHVMHFIIEGEGTCVIDGITYEVKKHQAFITPANVVCNYHASKENPWSYLWIHFNGYKSLELLNEAGIHKKNPIFTPSEKPENLLQALYDILTHHTLEYRCIGNLYRVFQELILLSNSKKENACVDLPLKYVQYTTNYILRRYTEPISITTIADDCGINRSYLSRIFKEATGYSPQEYLLYYRIKKAKQLLSENELPIQHVAYAVGYPDPFAFSKIFHKRTGLSPRDYRIQYLIKG